MEKSFLVPRSEVRSPFMSASVAEQQPWQSQERKLFLILPTIPSPTIDVRPLHINPITSKLRQPRRRAQRNCWMVSVIGDSHRSGRENTTRKTRPSIRLVMSDFDPWSALALNRCQRMRTAVLGTKLHFLLWLSKARPCPTETCFIADHTWPATTTIADRAKCGNAVTQMECGSRTFPY